MRAPRARPAIGTIDADSIRSRTSRSRTSWTASSSSRSTTSTAPPSDMAGQLVGVGRLGQPPADTLADPRRLHSLGHRVGSQEARLDEVAERLAELLLALGDDRGVRDRHPERVAEQRHHREPVGQAADHGGLGGGLHVPVPGAVLDPGRHGERRTPPRPRRAAAVARRRVVTSWARLASSFGDGGSGARRRGTRRSRTWGQVYPARGRFRSGAVADGFEGAAGLGGVLRAAHGREGAGPCPSGSRPWPGGGRARRRRRGRWPCG